MVDSVDKTEKKKRISINGKVVLALLGAVLGVFLLLSGGTGREENKTDQPDAQEEEARLAAYRTRLLGEIRDICLQVAGVGEVSVQISFERGFCAVYATEDGEYVKIGSGSSQKALYLYEESPKLAGVGIVCRGGGDARVRQEIVMLLSAALGIGANKIYVTEAQN